MSSEKYYDVTASPSLHISFFWCVRPWDGDLAGMNTVESSRSRWGAGEPRNSKASTYRPTVRTVSERNSPFTTTQAAQLSQGVIFWFHSIWYHYTRAARQHSDRHSYHTISPLEVVKNITQHEDIFVARCDPPRLWRLFVKCTRRESRKRQGQDDGHEKKSPPPTQNEKGWPLLDYGEELMVD